MKKLNTRQLTRIAARRAGAFSGDYSERTSMVNRGIAVTLGALTTPFCAPVGIGIMALGCLETNSQRRHRERQERQAVEAQEAAEAQAKAQAEAQRQARLKRQGAAVRRQLEESIKRAEAQ